MSSVNDNNDHSDSGDLTHLTAHVVGAYVSQNPLSPGDLPKVIADVYAALAGLGGMPAEPEPARTPAVPVRRSIQPDALTCLECGKKFKSLKRHLMTHHELTPQQYRERWSLSRDYPMVAPNYSATRSGLAKAAGLGRKPAEKGRRAKSRG